MVSSSTVRPRAPSCSPSLANTAALVVLGLQAGRSRCRRPDPSKSAWIVGQGSVGAGVLFLGAQVRDDRVVSDRRDVGAQGAARAIPAAEGGVVLLHELHQPVLHQVPDLFRGAAAEAPFDVAGHGRGHAALDPRRQEDHQVPLRGGIAGERAVIDQRRQDLARHFARVARLPRHARLPLPWVHALSTLREGRFQGPVFAYRSDHWLRILSGGASGGRSPARGARQARCHRCSEAASGSSRSPLRRPR